MDQARKVPENLSDEAVVKLDELSCEDVCDLLYLFLTNELEEDESQQVCSHLLNCVECRKAMAEHVKLNGSLKRAIPGIELNYYSQNN